ncbi:MAG: hypothetical protein QM756_34445 [Polyangiaceae bacterium]
MKTAISLPDDVFEEAERLASRLKVSRSELYAKALQEFVRRHSPDAVTEAYDAVVEQIPQKSDPFLQRASRKVAARNEW